MIIYQSKNKHMKIEILKIIDNLFDLQESGKADVFVSYYGHVNMLDVSIYCPIYNPAMKPILEAKVYTDATNTEINKFIDKVTEAIKLINL